VLLGPLLRLALFVLLSPSTTVRHLLLLPRLLLLLLLLLLVLAYQVLPEQLHFASSYGCLPPQLLIPAVLPTQPVLLPDSCLNRLHVHSLDSSRHLLLLLLLLLLTCRPLSSSTLLLLLLLLLLALLADAVLLHTARCHSSSGSSARPCSCNS
jgi:hypothetical protein